MPKDQEKRTAIGKGWKAATPGQDKPIDKRQKGRKIRRDVDTPRMNYRDILAFKWIGEQAVASADNLQELLGRPDMREPLGNLAGGTTKETEKLSATRIRHIIEDRWAEAGMVNHGLILGRRWVWPTWRALYETELPFSPISPPICGTCTTSTVSVFTWNASLVRTTSKGAGKVSAGVSTTSVSGGP